MKSMNPPIATTGLASRAPAAEGRRLKIAYISFATALIVSWAAIGFLEYRVPTGYIPIWGANVNGVIFFKKALGLIWIKPLSQKAFGVWFPTLLIIEYAAYALMLLAARRAAAIDLRRGMIIAGVLGAATAALVPPTFSTDIFSYAAYGHMVAWWHLNPYLTPTRALIPLGDPILPYMPRVHANSAISPLKWDIPTVYGPGWTLLSALIAWVARGHLWSEIVLLKLVEAGALILSAYSAHRMAKVVAPTRAPVIFLAVAFNPLLLAEGPGGGHNDLLMMSLVLLAGALLVEKRPGAAGIALGASIAVKLVPVLLIPWMVWEHRRNFGSMARFAGFTAGVAGVSVFGYVPFWKGPATLSAVLVRGTARPSTYGTLSANVASHAAPPLRSIAHDYAIPIEAYFALTALVVYLSIRKRRSSESGSTVAWALAWAVQSALLAYFVLKLIFPWYVIWLWPASLTSWNRSHLNSSLVCGCLGLITTSLYSQTSLQNANNTIVLSIWLTFIAVLGINYFSYQNKISKNSDQVELCIF